MSTAKSSWHSLRKRVHLVCFLIFVALPFLDVMRFDIPRQRFYFAGRELWINEFGVVFFSLMFLMFLVVAAAVFYGRIYCGYLCPQTIFSEAAVVLENRIRKAVGKQFARPVFYAVLAAGSVFLAFVFMAYFVPPRDLFWRLASFDLRTAGGITGASVTIITFLDFAFVRQRFCVTVCPYGYLQGMLGDGNTLLVHYRDPDQTCIECKKCVRVCQMGIDIRKSPYQIECVACGECIDACNDVLGRLKKPGLVHYTWGEQGETLGTRAGIPWLRRIGLRDAKRVIVLLVLMFYASGLFVALAMRRTVLVRIAPDRGDRLYRLADGRVYNKFRYTLANRGANPATVAFTLDGLPGAALPQTRVTVKGGETEAGEFEVSAPAAPGTQVRRFRIVSTTQPDRETDAVEMTFLAP